MKQMDETEELKSLLDEAENKAFEDMESMNEKHHQVPK